MLQVDPFTTFALGSSFAVAAAKQLKNEENPFENKYYLKVLLFFSFLFVPAVSYLLVQHPGWETMFALHTYMIDVDTPGKGGMIIPASAGFMIAGLIISSLTTGTLGFYFAFRLIKKDNLKGAVLLCMVGLFLTLFVLVYGWDGTGLERFLYSGNANNWHQWKALGGVNKYPVTVSVFLSSQIFKTLVVIFGTIVPVVLFIWFKWYKEGEKTHGLNTI